MAVNETDKTQVSEMVNDFLRYQLNRRDLQWTTCPPLPRPSKVVLVLRTLGDEFLAKYRDEFVQMCGRLDLTPSVAQTAFLDVLNELFSEGITWSRVVGAFAFSFELSAHCVEKNWSDLVDGIASWLSSYVCTRLLPWIQDHGGWVSDPPTRIPSPRASAAFHDAGFRRGGRRFSLSQFLLPRPTVSLPLNGGLSCRSLPPLPARSAYLGDANSPHSLKPAPVCSHTEVWADAEPPQAPKSGARSTRRSGCDVARTLIEPKPLEKIKTAECGVHLVVPSGSFIPRD